MAETASDSPRHDGFRREEAAQIRKAWRAGEALLCPRCDLELDPSPVPPRSDVSYVRDRVILVCRSCGGSTAMERRDRKVPAPALPVVGWREWVTLPAHGSMSIKAKVDTGARSSALHVEEVEDIERDGDPWLRFLVLPRQRSRTSAFRVEAPLVDRRHVRSSSGASEERPVVSLDIGLGRVLFSAEVTLTRRDQMGFRLLLGRTALQDRFLVNPATSYLQSPRLPGESPRGGSRPRPPSSRK